MFNPIPFSPQKIAEISNHKSLSPEKRFENNFNSSPPIISHHNNELKKMKKRIVVNRPLKNHLTPSQGNPNIYQYFAYESYNMNPEIEISNYQNQDPRPIFNSAKQIEQETNSSQNIQITQNLPIHDTINHQTVKHLEDNKKLSLYEARLANNNFQKRSKGMNLGNLPESQNSAPIPFQGQIIYDFDDYTTIKNASNTNKNLLQEISPKKSQGKNKQKFPQIQENKLKKDIEGSNEIQSLETINRKREYLNQKVYGNENSITKQKFEKNNEPVIIKYKGVEFTM